MDYKNPLIIKLTDKPSSRNESNPNEFNINTTQSWKLFKRDLHRAAEISEFDYIALTYDPAVLQPDSQVSRKTLDICSSEVGRVATSHQTPAITRFNKQIYQLNARFDEGQPYAPSNQEIIDKYQSFESNDAWQHHQAGVWSNLGAINGLNSGGYGENHLAILENPSRGLDKKDVQNFFSLRKNKQLIPTLMGDDMVGMPGVKARRTTDSFYVGDTLVGQGALSLTTMDSGYIIPMVNKNGDMAKFQVGSDVTAYNLKVQAKAEDGVSIMNSEFFDKKTRRYLFELEDGTKSELHAVEANNTRAVFEDVKGQFEIPIKGDLKPILEERGYKIPELIDTMKVVPNSKYAWPAPGNMIGTAIKGGIDVPKLVSPSEAGFIPVREPKGTDEYTLLVVEGALKGQIVAKYLDHPEVAEVTDAITGDPNKGLIVAQVPGVSKAFIQSAPAIFDTKNVTDTVIAMDADGRYNRNVAKGIHDAERIMGQKAPTRIMSWDPDQKGLDDALLALSRKQIEFKDMDLTFGKAAELFPLAQATPPNPYKLDGTRANRTNGDAQWQLDYRENLAERENRMKAIQEASHPEPNVATTSEPDVATASEHEQSSVNDTTNSEVSTEATQVAEAPKPTMPPVYQVAQSDLDRITSKASGGEISESDMQEFLQSVSDLTKALCDRVSEFAK